MILKKYKMNKLQKELQTKYSRRTLKMIYSSSANWAKWKSINMAKSSCLFRIMSASTELSASIPNSSQTMFWSWKLRKDLNIWDQTILEDTIKRNMIKIILKWLNKPSRRKNIYNKTIIRRFFRNLVYKRTLLSLVARTTHPSKISPKSKIIAQTTLKRKF